MIGLEGFKVIPDTGEEEITPGLSPEQTVCEIALTKASNVAKLCSDEDIILAADTLVYLEGQPIAKPDSPDDAAAMLRRLSGRKHTVYTGVAIIKGGIQTTAAEKTDVFFREISSREIADYVKTREPMDKAGAYAAQGRGALFIERIEGEFFNVMGLPLCRLSIMLRDYGVSI
jgi:septum formation protein